MQSRGLGVFRRRRWPVRVDFLLPSGNNARLDIVQLGRCISLRIARPVDEIPSRTDMALGVDRVSPLAVGLIARVGVFDFPVRGARSGGGRRRLRGGGNTGFCRGRTAKRLELAISA